MNRGRADARARQRARALPLALAAALLAGCAVHASQAAVPAPAAAQAGAAQAPAAQAPAGQPRRPVVRPQPDPGLALTEQIRAALSRRSWPAGFAQQRPGPVPEWAVDGCLDVTARNEQRCTYGPQSGTRTLALIGDSIAIGWLPGLRRAPSMRTTRIHVLTHRQCSNLRGKGPPACAAHKEWVLQRIRALRPDVAVLSSDYDGKQDWYQWRAGLRRTLAALRPYAKTLIVVAPHPDLPDARDCYDRRIPPGACRTSVPLNWRQYGEAEREAAVAIGARFVDPRPWVCALELCPALIGDTPVSFDGNHLSAAYAARLGPVLSRAIR